MAMCVSAYEYEDIINQEQLDAINMDTAQIQLSWYGVNSGFYKIPNRDLIMRNTYIDRFINYNKTHYQYVKRPARINTDSYTFYNLCKLHFGVTDCYRYFLILSEKNRYKKVQNIREQMKRMQTQPDEPVIIME